MDRVSRAASRATLASLALSLGAVLGACARGEGGANAAAAGPYAKEVREAVPLIEKAVGLPF